MTTESQEVTMRNVHTLSATSSDAQREAIAWLASQIDWERMLGSLRSTEQSSPAKKAA
jgi:hypothetical protein